MQHARAHCYRDARSLLHSQPVAAFSGDAFVSHMISHNSHARRYLSGVALIVISLTSRLPAQTSQGNAPMGADPIGLPMTRMGSGTSWLPDSAPMFGSMRSAGSWMFMLHGTAFIQHVAQSGPRGDSQFGSVNWGMVNAMRPLAGGRLQVRGMGSIDVFTVGGRGYPLLLQTGESYRGEQLHDRQHPHDMLMEIAAVYERALSTNVGMQLYAAAAGEPALGPVAFPHRPTASADPLATIAHHWQDATHVSFGVLTAGVYTKGAKLEGSVFNGREPDGIRTNLDYQNARLDSYSGRITVAPTPSLTMSASLGRLADAEAAHPGIAVRRAVGSVLWSRERRDAGSQSLALNLGANAVGDETWSRSITMEGMADIRARLQLTARAEVVEKSGEELVLDHHDETRYRVAQLTLGVVRENAFGRFGRIGVGMRGTLNVLPATLSHVYKTRTPVGAAFFLRWRTGRMKMGAMDGMDHTKHNN